MEELTERQREILSFIVKETETRGFPPTIREIGEQMDIRSTNGVNDHLKALEKSMQKIVNEGQTFRRRVVTHDEALAELADEPYKLELIGLSGGPGSGDADPDLEATEGASMEVGGDELTIYPYQPGPIEVTGRSWYGGITHTIDTLTIQPREGIA